MGKRVRVVWDCSHFIGALSDVVVADGFVVVCVEIEVIRTGSHEVGRAKPSRPTSMID